MAADGCPGLLNREKGFSIMKTIKQAIRALRRCGGDCINCKHCQIKIADLTDHITVYAWFCDVADEAGFLWYGERLDDLRDETLGMLLKEERYMD